MGSQFIPKNQDKIEEQSSEYTSSKVEKVVMIEDASDTSDELMDFASSNRGHHIANQIHLIGALASMKSKMMNSDCRSLPDLSLSSSSSHCSRLNIGPNPPLFRKFTNVLKDLNKKGNNIGTTYGLDSLNVPKEIRVDCNHSIHSHENN